MKLTGEQIIAQQPEKVFIALNTPQILQQCIPGCEKLEKKSDTEMEATVVLKVGPVKAAFKGNITLSDINAPHSYTISGQGSGGAAGFAQGSAKVTLEPQSDNTILRYDVSAQVGGKIAQLGSRLIDSTAKRLADQFFRKFSEILGGEKNAGETRKPSPTNATSNNTLILGFAIASIAALLVYLLIS